MSSVYLFIEWFIRVFLSYKHKPSAMTRVEMSSKPTCWTVCDVLFIDEAYWVNPELVFALNSAISAQYRYPNTLDFLSIHLYLVYWHFTCVCPHKVFEWDLETRLSHLYERGWNLTGAVVQRTKTSSHELSCFWKKRRCCQRSFEIWPSVWMLTKYELCVLGSPATRTRSAMYSYIDASSVTFPNIVGLFYSKSKGHHHYSILTRISEGNREHTLFRKPA